MNTTNVILSVIAVAVVIIATVIVYKWNEEEQVKRNLQAAFDWEKNQQFAKSLGVSDAEAECYAQLSYNNTEYAYLRCKLLFGKELPKPVTDCYHAVIKDNADTERCSALEKQLEEQKELERDRKLKEWKDCLGEIPGGQGITSSNKTAIHECAEARGILSDKCYELMTRYGYDSIGAVCQKFLNGE